MIFTRLELFHINYVFLEFVDSLRAFFGHFNRLIFSYYSFNNSFFFWISIDFLFSSGLLEEKPTRWRSSRSARHHHPGRSHSLLDRTPLRNILKRIPISVSSRNTICSITSIRYEVRYDFFFSWFSFDFSLNFAFVSRQWLNGEKKCQKIVS